MSRASSSRSSRSFDPLHPKHHHHLRLVISLLIGAILAMTAVAMIAWYVERDNHHPPVVEPLPDIVWATAAKNSSTWYELTSTSQQPIAYAGLADTTITGITRAGGVTFVLGLSGSRSSTLYEYGNAKYIPLYTSSQPLITVAMSSDGTEAAFTALTSTSTESAHVVVLNLLTKQLDTIGAGSSPILLNAGGIMSVLYTNGSSMYASSFVHNAWVSPQSFYTSPKDFPLVNTIATNGTNLFAFVDPEVDTAQLWKVTTLAPFTATPQTIYTQTPRSTLIFLDGHLFSLVATSVPNLSSSSVALTLGDFTASSTIHTFSLPASTLRQSYLITLVQP